MASFKHFLTAENGRDLLINVERILFIAAIDEKATRIFFSDKPRERRAITVQGSLEEVAQKLQYIGLVSPKGDKK